MIELATTLADVAMALVAALAVGVLPALAVWIRARAAVEAAKAEAARTQVELSRTERQRDAVIEGVEAAAGPEVKASIKRTSIERGVEVELDEQVERVKTERRTRLEADGGA